ncbi:hypothetical protein KTR9_5089 (plasmid) [Gordonia sp. KTR9]|nr:hypothetical protein KTR9_5089 [Gordonia sp. KTR9]
MWAIWVISGATMLTEDAL